MTQQQIQDFLNTREGILKNYRETRNSYIGRYNNWPAQGKTAAEIIWQVGQEYGISPRIIITTLEKEESLISMPNPQQWRIDSAMGYAYFDSAWDDNHCLAPVGTAANITNPTGSCKGFAIQVDWGTSGALDPNFNHAKDVGSNRTICAYYDGNYLTYGMYHCPESAVTSVYIGNRSTASIYSYTPYLTIGSHFYDLYYGFSWIDGPPSAVYRFWNTNGTHFYTASQTERDNINKTLGYAYRYEGEAYPLNYNSGRNTVPLYRFYNTANKTHFYTANQAEADNINSNFGYAYKFEGAAWHVTLDPANSMPVFRYFNVVNGTHFYTANTTERDDINSRLGYIYRYEGIAYYVPY